MAKKVTKKSSNWVARKYGFKSGLEENISIQIESKGIKVEYESEKVAYTIPASQHTYNPDFKLPNGGYTPSRVVYGEYRNLVFGTETQNFTVVC